jgi:hypothetical protein
MKDLSVTEGADGSGSPAPELTAHGGTLVSHERAGEIPPLAAATTSLATGVALQPVASATSPALQRAHGALAHMVPAGAYYVTRLGPSGVTGIAALVAAVVIGLTALLGTRSASEDLLSRISAVQLHHAAPTPEQELARVVTTLPPRERMPQIVGEVLQQATAAGVPLGTGHYSFSPASAGRVARYELEFPVTADYPQVRDFINRTLQKVPYATLDKLHIERKAIGDGTVKADVRFVVFVNDGAIR